MKKNMRIAHVCMLICAASLLSGCQQNAMKVNMSAAEALNVDARQQSLPVVVKVYQLNDKSLFETASFNQLWKNDHETLRHTVLSKEESLIYPSEQKQLKLSLSEETQYIGVVALFRDANHAQWRGIKSVKQGIVDKKLPKKIRIKLENNELKVG